MEGEVLSTFWIGAVALGPLILLLWLGRKVLKGLNLSDHQQRDFLIGLFGIILLNALLYSLSLALRVDSIPPKTRATMFLALPWVLNFALLIFFSFYRPWIALGALALIGFLLTWVVLAGVFFFASCFVLIGVAALLES
jgi:hypothetical protein